MHFIPSLWRGEVRGEGRGGGKKNPNNNCKKFQHACPILQTRGGHCVMPSCWFSPEATDLRGTQFHLFMNTIIRTLWVIRLLPPPHFRTQRLCPCSAARSLQEKAERDTGKIALPEVTSERRLLRILFLLSQQSMGGCVKHKLGIMKLPARNWLSNL